MILMISGIRNVSYEEAKNTLLLLSRVMLGVTGVGALLFWVTVAKHVMTTVPESRSQSRPVPYFKKVMKFLATLQGRGLQREWESDSYSRWGYFRGLTYDYETHGRKIAHYPN